MILSIGILLLSSVVISSANLCPVLEGKIDFEPEKFAGDWHYAAYNTNPNRPWELDCAEFNVTVAQAENTTGIFKLAYIFNYLSNGKKTLVTMNTETIEPNKPGLFLSAGKRVQSNFWSDVHQAAILDTDYENYAAAILCAPVYKVDTNTFEASIWGYIWSRSRTLKDETFDAMQKLLVDNGIAEADIRDLRNSVGCSDLN